MQNTQDTYEKKSLGFTIVELLIVIVVIAILAAIGIVAYRGVQNRANDAAVQADMRTAITALQAAQAQYDRLPSSAPEIIAVGFKLNKNSYYPETNNALLCIGSTRYGMAGLSKSGTAFTLSNIEGAKVFSNWSSDSATICNTVLGGEALVVSVWGWTNGYWWEWTNAT